MKRQTIDSAVMFGLNVYKNNRRVGKGYNFILLKSGLVTPPTLWDKNNIELDEGDYEMAYTGAQTLVVIARNIQ